MADIRLIVGLGNIGAAYEATRHNAGFWFVDLLADEYRANLALETRFRGAVAKANIGGHSVWLLKPHTLMNLSGQAVAALTNFYKIAPDEILVVHDELDMLPGQAKLKKGGGVAGHNGLKDIRQRCGGDNFWRLRIGIGHPRELNSRQPVADFVLRPPSQDDTNAIEDAMRAALPLVPQMLGEDMREAMQSLHRAVGKPPAKPAAS
ncbi:MAG: aminoacyl-tRNA hydrolase [Burkholderiaceae bacterium]